MKAKLSIGLLAMLGVSALLTTALAQRGQIPIDPFAQGRSSDAERSLALRVEVLARKLGETKPEADRSQIKTELGEILEKQFALRQKRHQEEIAELETKVKKLKDLVENGRRIAARSSPRGSTRSSAMPKAWAGNTLRRMTTSMFMMSVRVFMPGISLAMARDRCCGSQDQPAGLDAFGADQLVRKLTDVAGRTAQQDHLETPPLVQVNMSGGDDLLKMAVLQLGQAFGDPAGVVIVNQGDYTHRLGVFLVDHFLDERISSSGRVRPRCGWDSDAPRDTGQTSVEVRPDRNAEADERLFHNDLLCVGRTIQAGSRYYGVGFASRLPSFGCTNFLLDCFACPSPRP